MERGGGVMVEEVRLGVKEVMEGVKVEAERGGGRREMEGRGRW